MHHPQQPVANIVRAPGSRLAVLCSMGAVRVVRFRGDVYWAVSVRITRRPRADEIRVEPSDGETSILGRIPACFFER